MDETFKRYDVFATADQLRQLHELLTTSQGPLLGVSYRSVTARAQAMEDTRARYYELVDQIAVDGGLPAPEKDADGDVIHYGVDFSNGQILGVA